MALLLKGFSIWSSVLQEPPAHCRGGHVILSLALPVNSREDTGNKCPIAILSVRSCRRPSFSSEDLMSAPHPRVSSLVPRVYLPDLIYNSSRSRTTLLVVNGHSPCRVPTTISFNCRPRPVAKYFHSSCSKIATAPRNRLLFFYFFFSRSPRYPRRRRYSESAVFARRSTSRYLPTI
jgi:hypothetical protein